MAAALSDPSFRRLNHRAVECLYCRPEVSEISPTIPVPDRCLPPRFATPDDPHLYKRSRAPGKVRMTVVFMERWEARMQLVPAMDSPSNEVMISTHSRVRGVTSSFSADRDEPLPATRQDLLNHQVRAGWLYVCRAPTSSTCDNRAGSHSRIASLVTSNLTLVVDMGTVKCGQGTVQLMALSRLDRRKVACRTASTCPIRPVSGQPLCMGKW